MSAPVIVKPIPAQVINEQAAYGPFNLKEFIQSTDGSNNLRFSAEVKGGGGLPKGMICTADGVLTGIPAKETSGNYELTVYAENDEGSVDTTFVMTIKPAPSGADYADRVKAQIWEALEQNLPLPDLGDLMDRPITALDIYYLLERWGVLTIWDAFNLEPPGEKALLNLEGVSRHYNVYDRGSCLIAAPKDLYSHERTLEDSLQTARAMAREVYKRNWTIELAGFDKMVRGAWIEVQHQGDLHGKRLEVINFSPSPDDVKVYTTQAMSMGMGSGSDDNS